MIRKQKAGLEWLEFDLLQPFPNVVHGVFLRSKEDQSRGSDSFNISVEADGSEEKAIKSSEKIQQILGVSSLVSCFQSHGDIVKEVSELRAEEECDGIITKEKSKALIIMHADCQAAIFYDPVQKIVANVHSGWRGNVKNIYANTIEKMQEMGSQVEDIIVCISPSLGPDRSEFVNFENELPYTFWPFQVRPLYFNLWEISRLQLEEAGILPEHIEIAGICTYDNPEDFYSYRRDKVKGRNNATAVALV